jgi:hypothetical protein
MPNTCRRSVDDSPYWRSNHPYSNFLLCTLVMPAMRTELQLWLLAAALSITVWWMLAKEQWPSVLRTMKRLRNDLPWFELQPVTCHALGEVQDLHAVLERHGYRVVELDGRRIHSFADLAAALQEHTRPLRWPEDPRRRVRALLRQIGTTAPRRCAIVWRDVLAVAARDPAFVTTVLSECAAQAMTMPAGSLWFVDLPAVAPAEREPVRLPEREPVSAERAALADAPDGAWWKPQPGELGPQRASRR